MKKKAMLKKPLEELYREIAKLSPFLRSSLSRHDDETSLQQPSPYDFVESQNSANSEPLPEIAEE